jgi:ribosomal-protein-alanine N-acetyltransferase
VSRSDPDALIMSTYRFPDLVRVDELLLRAPDEADVEVIAPAFVDPAVGGEAGLPPVGPDALRAFMREQLAPMRAQGLLAPYVVADPDGTILGGLTLHHFDPMRDAVEVGYWLFSEARGRGVATRSVGALVDHAFDNGLCRVEAHVRLGNRDSERVLERLGFEREGVRRKFLRHEGRRVDATIFSRLADDA